MRAGNRRCIALLFLALLATRGARAQSGAEATAVLVIRGDSLRLKGEVARAIDTFRQAIATDSGNALARFHLAYALLAADRTADAIPMFLEGLKRDPTYRDGFRQLGYLYSTAGENDKAFSAFVSAQAIGGLTPRDWVEVGYVQARRGNPVESRAAFGTALAEGDSAVRVLATTAISAAPAAAPSLGVDRRRTMYAETYLVPLYQSRFTNTIGQGFVRLGLQSTSPSGLTPYLSVRIQKDSKSVGEPFPSIYGDNSVIPAIGVKTTPFASGPTLYAEGGDALMLLDDGKGSRVRPEFRIGGYYSKGWWHPHNIRSEFYTDATYYTRYEHNAITYLQLRETWTAYSSPERSLELFTRFSGVGDSKRISYNNAVEFAPGFIIVPGSTRRIVFLAERIGGHYLIEPFPGAVTNYHDVRVMAIIYAIGTHRVGAR